MTTLNTIRTDLEKNNDHPSLPRKGNFFTPLVVVHFNYCEMITGRMGIFRTGIVGLILVCCTFIVDAQISKSEESEFLDARNWDFSKRLPLKTNWSFFENSLVHPDSISYKDARAGVFFPAIWNDQRADGKGTGYATYVLNIVVPDSIERLALEVPQLYSGYKLWVNGDVLASAGTVGTEKEAVVPQWIYRTVSFDISNDTLQLVLQLANFHHYKGGAKDPIYLGTPDRIDSHFAWAIGSNTIEASILLLEGIFFLFFYYKHRKRVILYFALVCLTWSVRSVFSNLYPLVLVFPDMNWQWLVKVEYLTLYLTAIWAALFFNCLFKEARNVIFIYLPIALNLFFVLFTLLTPVAIFSRWVSMYLAVAAFVILYGATMIIRALIFDNEGSWFLMASVGIGVLIFGYDIAAYQSSFSYNVVFLNIGYVMIFMLTTIALLFHLGIFKSEFKKQEVLTYNDLYRDSKTGDGKA